MGNTRAEPLELRLGRLEGLGGLAAPPHVGTEHARGPLDVRAFPHPARHTGVAGSH